MWLPKSVLHFNSIARVCLWFLGIDLAFIENGFIYHTKYDTANRILTDSIQRAGNSSHMHPYLNMNYVYVYQSLENDSAA